MSDAAKKAIETLPSRLEIDEGRNELIKEILIEPFERDKDGVVWALTQWGRIVAKERYKDEE